MNEGIEYVDYDYPECREEVDPNGEIQARYEELQARGVTGIALLVGLCPVSKEMHEELKAMAAARGDK